MDVKAIVILGAPSESHETIAGTPYALVDVLGRPITYHIVDRLRRAEISDVKVLTEVPPSGWPIGTAAYGEWIHVTGDQVWRKAEQVFEALTSDAQSVIVLRVGAYAEIDFCDLIQHHTEMRQRITAVVDREGVPLDIFAIGSSRRNDAAYLFRHQLRESRTGSQLYRFPGYVNRLTSAHDLRKLSIDALMQRIDVKPNGKQVKPGVWVGRGAQIHRRARVLSPAFIGAGSRVRAAAVITRCSALEHHTVVDCGTVVENVSTLPHTYLGAGLDVTQSVVGRSRVWNLERNVEVEFADARLIGEASASAPVRALGSLLSLIGFLPAKLLSGLFTPSHRECPPSLPEAIRKPAAALEASATIQASAPSVDGGEFPANLVIARRYGNE